MPSKSWFLVPVLAALCAAVGPAPAQQLPAKEPERTRGELEKAAAKGDAEAQYRLGLDYSRGGGEGSNLPLAVRWLTRAAEHGHAESWLALGDLHAEGGVGLLQDAGAARECYRKAEDKGTSEVYRSLGGVYRWGHGGVTADWGRSQAFYLKAAKQGDRESQYVCGQFYQYGIGTAANLERAVHWYTEAARQGDHSAEEKLGWLYEHGNGVDKDPKAALSWYKKAEQHGGHCWWHRRRLGDPEALGPRPPDPAVPVARDIAITLETEKAEYDQDDLIVIAVRYRNVGKDTYSFTENYTGGFHVPFTVKDDKGRLLPNPYEEASYRVRGGSFLTGTQILEPGKTVVVKRTLNQCVHFEKPGTYSVSTSEYVYLGGDGGWRGGMAPLSAEASPLILKVRTADREKRQKDIDRLVRAYRDGTSYPKEMARPAEEFPGNSLNILRRLVFFNEPKLLPVLLDALERGDNADFAETGLRALADRAAVLKALEERLDHPERYNTLDLLYPYFRLSGLEDWDPFGEPGRLDDWKREAVLTREVREKAMLLLRRDTKYRYGRLVPGLLGGSDDLFLIDYLIRSGPSLDQVRQCSGSLKKVKLGREHTAFLESQLAVERDWAVADAAILQLVRFDRDRYLSELKAHKERFSPEVVKFLLEAEKD
jgi:TPR repeat protein